MKKNIRFYSMYSAFMSIIIIVSGNFFLSTDINSQETPKLDAKLSAVGKKREASIQGALASTKDRIAKAKWRKRLGETHKAYQQPGTHMPQWLRFATEIKPSEIDVLRHLASRHALNEAQNLLRRSGAATASEAEAKQFIKRQDDITKDLNSYLAKEIARLREAAQKGDQTELDGILMRAAQQTRDAMARAQGLSIKEPEGVSESGKMNMTREHYYTFMNRLSLN